jgi:hypothetical protein
VDRTLGFEGLNEGAVGEIKQENKLFIRARKITANDIHKVLRMRNEELRTVCHIVI